MRNSSNKKEVKGRDIPGFSKWITFEVYVEDKLAINSLENVALNAIDHVNWINGAMDEIINNDLSEGIEDEDMEDIKKDNDINDKSMLLLKSPRNVNRSTSPSRQREIELIKDTATLVLDDTVREFQRDGYDIENDEETNKENATEDGIEEEEGEEEEEEEEEVEEEQADLYEEKDNNIEESSSPNRPILTNPDDSFELIKRDIRKSFAAKQKIQSVLESEMDTQAVPLLEKTSDIKAAEDEIKELSRLIERVSDVDDEHDINGQRIQDESAGEEENFSIEFDKLEKIEVSDIKNKSTVYKSPIKFSEMPTIEPLTIGSERKKSLKRSIRKVKSGSTTPSVSGFSNTEPTSINSTKSGSTIKKASTISMSIFDENSNNKSKQLDLKPLPNAQFSAGNTSMDEPTIKLNRNLVEKFKYQPSKPQERNDEGTGNEDLLSRLMQPTESSRKKMANGLVSTSKFASPISNQRKSNIATVATIDVSNSIKHKSMKISSKSSPRGGVKLEMEDETYEGSKDGEKIRKLSDFNIPELKVKLEEEDDQEEEMKAMRLSPIKKSGIVAPTSNKKMPLTKKSLKSVKEAEQISKGKLQRAKDDNDSNKMMFYREQIGRKVLKKVSKTSIRLNTPASVPTAQVRSRESPAKDSESWASAQEVRKQLLQQRGIPPESVFGAVPVVEFGDV